MQLGALATYAPTPPGRTKTLARVVVCQIGGGSRVGAPSKSVCLGKPRIGQRRWRMGPRRRNARAAQSARTLLSRRGARWWRTRPRGGRRRWYAIAASTRPGTPLNKMDRRSLCRRGDGGNAMCQQRRSQSDVERVVRVRRRLLAEKRLDALVRQAQLLHRARVLDE